MPAIDPIVSFIVVHGSVRLARSAGSRPKTMPVSNRETERERQDARIGARGDQQRLALRRHQREQRARQRERQRRVRPRRRRATSTRLSTSSWRTSCRRDAPSDSRTAISFWRVKPRAISRLATLAHAISRTSPTMHISTMSAVEKSLRIGE